MRLQRWLQKKANLRKIKDALLEIKNNRKNLDILSLLLLDAEYTSERMGTYTKLEQIATPDIPRIIEKGEISPYWSKIFRQMEETNWDIEKLKI